MALERSSTRQKDAASIIAAASAIATTTITTAAADAVKTLNTAAAQSAKIVSDTASKALSEFPRLQDDIREIRTAQQMESSTTVSMVRDLIQTHTKGQDIVLNSINTTVKAVEAHMITQNGRLDRAETHITRQNVAIFGVAGPVALIILGAIARQLMTTVTTAEKFGTVVNWSNLFMIGLGVVVILVAGLTYFGFKVYKSLQKVFAQQALSYYWGVDKK